MLYDRIKINKISICKGNSPFFVTASDFQKGLTSTSKIVSTAFIYRLPLYAAYEYFLPSHVKKWHAEVFQNSSKNIYYLLVYFHFQGSLEPQISIPSVRSVDLQEDKIIERQLGPCLCCNCFIAPTEVLNCLIERNQLLKLHSDIQW